MKLTPIQKERIRFHLGFNYETIDSYNLFLAEQRLGASFTELSISLLKKNLDGLDITYEALTDTTSATREEIIVGDVNRTISNRDADPRILEKRYEAQCRLLSESIGIPCFRGQGISERTESTIVSQVQRADGSSVGSRLLMADLWA